MILSTWIRNWKRSLDRRWTLRQTLRQKQAFRRPACHPRLEVLEDRCLLSTYVVTSNADTDTPGTLRYGITQANNPANNITEIDFNIGTVGSPQSISLLSALPALTANGVFINGLSQGGDALVPLITLNGSAAGSGSDGLQLQGANCTVSGLILASFGKAGIEVDGSSNIIGGTTIGAGDVLEDNAGDGVLIESGASGTQVLGNFIGTNPGGTLAMGNVYGVFVNGNGNTIGGSAEGAQNIISGNSASGVELVGSGNQVLGNFIGNRSRVELQ